MQVWQLMAILAKAKSGAEVVIAHSAGSYCVPAVEADAESDDASVCITGDGKFNVLEKHEQGK